MSKKRIAPDEAFGPAIDGLDLLAITEHLPLEEKLEEENIETDEENFTSPVALIIGAGEVAEETAKLCAKCSFLVEIALPNSASQNDFSFADRIYDIPDFENIVQICNIDKDYFVCVFLDNIHDCELVLSQCLASDAMYLGLYGDLQKRDEVFTLLREDGEPDTELAAIAAPMGLNIGAQTAEQKAVAIVAEMLASRAGKLKRLHHGK